MTAPVPTLERVHMRERGSEEGAINLAVLRLGRVDLLALGAEDLRREGI